VQGVERVDRELLDAQALVGHLVAEGSMFAFLADHRQGLFPDGEFEDLFPSGKGRPSIPASVMAAIARVTKSAVRFGVCMSHPLPPAHVRDRIPRARCSDVYGRTV
jgi:hypothetical protein